MKAARVEVASVEVLSTSPQEGGVDHFVTEMCVKLPTGTHHYISPVNRHSHSGLPGNEEADRQANAVREDSGNTVRERTYISAANRTRRISEQRAAAKAVGKRAVQQTLGTGAGLIKREAGAKFQREAKSHLLRDTTNLSAGMRPLQRTSSASTNETAISVGGAGRRPRRGSISSATVGSGRTSSGNCGEQSGEKQAGNRGGIGTCKYPSCFYREVRSSGDGLPRGNRDREIPTPLS
jgi:hypothetical protein